MHPIWSPVGGLATAIEDLSIAVPYNDNVSRYLNDCINYFHRLHYSTLVLTMIFCKICCLLLEIGLFSPKYKADILIRRNTVISMR